MAVVSSKRRAVLSLAFALLLPASWGQEPTQQPTFPRRQRSPAEVANDLVETRIREIVASLQLSGEQQMAVRSLLVNREQQEKAIRQDSALLPQQKQEQLRELNETARTQVEALLTPDQRVTLGLELATGPAKTAQNALNWLDQLVTLSDSQKDQLLRIFEEQIRQAQAVRLDGALLVADKRDRLLRIRRETYRQVVGLLTLDQQRELQNSPAILQAFPLLPELPF